MICCFFYSEEDKQATAKQAFVCNRAYTKQKQKAAKQRLTQMRQVSVSKGEGDEIKRGAGARLRQDARAEPLPGCRDSSRSGPGGKPGRSRTRSGQDKGETPCGLRVQMVRWTIALDRPKRSGDTPHRVTDEMPCLVKGGAP